MAIKAVPLLVLQIKSYLLVYPGSLFNIMDNVGIKVISDNKRRLRVVSLAGC